MKYKLVNVLRSGIRYRKYQGDSFKVLKQLIVISVYNGLVSIKSRNKVRFR